MVKEVVNIGFKSILMGLFLLSSILRAQFESAPYQFKERMYLKWDGVYEGFIYKESVPNLISVMKNVSNKIEVRISDKDFLFIDNMLFDADSSSASPFLSIYDFDNDGLDEIIFPLIHKNRTEFYLYNSNTEKSYKKEPFFTIFGTNSDSYTLINYNYLNLDNDDEKEVLIYLCENFPEKGSIRGIFAVDISYR